MVEKIKNKPQFMLIVMIIICLGAIMAVGFNYIGKMRNNLQEHAIQTVMTVTSQQRQAFDNFISGDQERIHSYARFFSRTSHSSPEEIQNQLTMFNEINATWSVICLDEGWFCSNDTPEIRWLDEEYLDLYRSFEGSGIRDSFTGLYTGKPRFGYYEAFTFENGHKGLIQKSYDRTRISESFSLSFYNDRGLAYVVNRDGDILLRSVGMIGDRLYENIVEIVEENNAKQEDIDQFIQALNANESGSMTLYGNKASYVYSYVPLQSVDGWFLVSIVPLDAISAETNQILFDTQITLGLLALIMVVFALFLLFIWRTRKDIADKEDEVKYQTKLFDIFTTYLSRNTNDMYMLVDHETETLEYVSPNVEWVLGVEPEQVIKALKSPDMKRDVEDAEAYFNAVNSLKPGQTLEPANTEWINPHTGEHKYFQENVYCADIQGRNKRVVYITDRTKDQTIQNSLTEALKMAQTANEAKSAFLSNVSHDIRTPMNAIIGFLALMRDETHNPAMVMEYTQRIEAASQHLLGLINDVLDMNKIESGSATLNISELNLASVIDEINTIIRPQAKAKEQTFDIFVSHINYEHLLGDKLRLNQILINLLSNAVKYTPEQGTIHMRVDELPQVVDNYSRIRFTVSDNGVGMSEEYLKVIFDPFTREDTEMTRQIQGTGLGMAITKSLVDLMGGTISVESELGEGSKFVVELELRIQEQAADPKFWNEHKVTRMIVADDDEEACHNIVKAMAQTGVLVDYSTNGETAVQMMRLAREAGKPYDLILLDWKMPNLDGLATARLIRQNYPDKIPILLLTAYDWSDIEQEAIEIGVNHFMPKPFFMTNFKEAIRRVMRSQRKDDTKKADFFKGVHVMVVDDIEVNRIILVKILNSLGAVCDVAVNGQEALDKFLESPPGDYDLIMMDVQMPVMDGYKATRLIRESSHPDAKTLPIIAMTANAFVDDVRDALESGMDAHIAKPLQLETMKATIREVLDNRKSKNS